MSSGADIRDTDALGELKTAFGCFAANVLQILPTIQRESEEIEEWLDERQRYWERQVGNAQDELYAAKRSLSSCEDSGYYDSEGEYQPPECSFEEEEVSDAQRRLAECESNLQTVKQWRHRIEGEIAALQSDNHRLSQLASVHTGSAQAFLAQKIDVLGLYLGGASHAASSLQADIPSVRMSVDSKETVTGASQSSADSTDATGAEGKEELYFCAKIRNQHLAGKTHPVTHIPFDKYGFADFSSVAIKTVSVKASGSRFRDLRAANKAAGILKKPSGYVWHHCEGTTMQLVPEDDHAKTGHTGGAAGHDALYTYKFPRC